MRKTFVIFITLICLVMLLTGCSELGLEELPSLGQVKVHYRVKGHLGAVARAIESLRERLGKDTPLYLSYVGDQAFLDELSKLLDEGIYLCPMSPLMQKWFGKEGCSVAGLSL